MKAKPTGTLRIRISALAVLILAAAPVFAAETFTVDKVHSNAQFTIRHLMSKVTGKFTDVEGAVQVDRAKPEASAVEFKIKTASIDTANKQRDDHLRSPDFFDAANNPEITFKSTKMKATGKDSYQVTGTLTIRGVSKEITVPVTLLGEMKDPWGNDRVGFEVQTTLNRKDYNILWNKTLDAGGYLLGDDVTVALTLEAVKKKEEPATK
jgi:polyisoprenoid-binding protein YceI